MGKLNRGQRELHHTKSSSISIEEGFPNVKEGNEGDITLRHIRGNGVYIFAKFRNRWYSRQLLSGQGRSTGVKESNLENPKPGQQLNFYDPVSGKNLPVDTSEVFNVTFGSPGKLKLGSALLTNSGDSANPGRLQLGDDISVIGHLALGDGNNTFTNISSGGIRDTQFRTIRFFCGSDDDNSNRELVRFGGASILTSPTFIVESENSNASSDTNSPGCILKLRRISTGVTVDTSNQAGSLYCQGGDTDSKIFFKNHSGTVFDLTTAVSGTYLPLAGGTMSGNVDFGDNDITNVDSLDADKFSIASGTEMTAINDEDDMSSDSNTALSTQQSIKAYADTKMALSGGTVTGDINLNNDVKVIYGDAGEHILGDGSDLQLTSSGSVTVTSGIFEVVSTGTGTPTLKIKNTSNQFGSGAQLHFDINPDDNVGADGDDIGLILFKTDDDGGNVTSYASILGEISDASNGTEDGKLSLNIAVAGTLTAGIEIKESSSSPIPDITINGSSVFNNTLDINNHRIIDAQRVGFNGGGYITSLIDNDDMSSASSTSVSSSESIKAYVDTTITQIIPCGFLYSYTAGTKVFLPLNGYIIELSTTTGVNEFVSFVAPFDGYLDQVVVRSEHACGSTVVGFHKSSTGTEVPNTTASASVTVDMTADDTPFKFNFTSSNTFSAGQILAISFQPTNDADDTNASVVFVFDRTSGL